MSPGDSGNASRALLTNYGVQIESPSNRIGLGGRRGAVALERAGALGVLYQAPSTKHRAPSIDDAIRDDLHAYLAGVAKRLDCTPHKIGGVDDHVHLVCSCARTVAISKLVQELKQASSKWAKARGDRYASFAWQNGYGAFSVAQSQLDDVRRYIAKQREHHQGRSYQEEFRTLLRRYEIDYDERWGWD